MPGIVGLISKMPRDRAVAELTSMAAAVSREPFYVSGTWVDEPLGVYVAWTARKNSFSDGMPLHNERGDVSLVFSGEDYAEPGTARRLEERGHSMGSAEAAYLVHLYEENPDFLATLNGVFHGLLIDRSRRAMMLFNDRFGMHPIYYHEAKEAFYFAVEAKAILAVRPELRTADFGSLGELVACGCILENRTVFKGISALPAGSAWLFRDKSIVRKGTYFQPREWENQAPLEPEPYYRELREVFSQNLSRYFTGPERIGMTLTGGLDTRVIVALHKASPGSLPCYTFRGPFRECEDVRVARRVARACGQSHEVITVGDTFLSDFPRYAERCVYLSEGRVDVSRSSDLYVSEKAREIAPAKVVGTYGSEILCRAVMFKPRVPTPELYNTEFASYLEQARKTYAELLRVHPVTFAAFRQSPWYHCGILNLEQSQLSVRSPYIDNDFVRTVFRAPESNGTNGDVRLRLVDDGNPDLSRIQTDRGIGGSSGRLFGKISRSVLDFTLKAEYAYDYGMPQWLARVDRIFAPLHLDRFFLGRHKLLHFRIWYRDRLAGYVREILLDRLTLSRPYIERKSVEGIVCGHLRGNRNHTTEIHKLLTLELLHRLFLDAR